MADTNMLVSFLYHLKEHGIPISVKYAMELVEAIRKGLATDMGRFFILARLICVKKVEYYDAYEQAFASFFLGKKFNGDIKEHLDVLNSPLFKSWLKQEIEKGNLEESRIHEVSLPELLEKFWQTFLEQKGEHHGGHRWIGTGGTSLFGHSGSSAGGIRVGGDASHFSALKVIQERRYIDYASGSSIRMENLSQVLQTLRNLVPVGPETELDVDETIYRTAKNGGEIELCFTRELRNRLKILLLLDNGGYSMIPYTQLVSLVFNKLRHLFDEVETYYFHNCIYGHVYRNPERTKLLPLEKFVGKSPASRVIIIGDANMAPSELFLSDGAMDWETNARITGLECLKKIAERFRCSVWLNPIPKAKWHLQSPTIRNIAGVFHMEDLTLDGIKNAVEFLNERGKIYSRNLGA